MVKTKGPALSLEATGSVKQLISFVRTKGRNVVKASKVPKNPRSGAQRGVRAMMGFLGHAWNGQFGGPGTGWDPAANARGIAPYHAYVAENARRWQNFKAPSKNFPATEDGSFGAFLSTSVTGGVRQLVWEYQFSTVNQNGGLMFFRSTSAGAALTIDNCIHVMLLDDGLKKVFIDSPVNPGVWFINIRMFTRRGRITGPLGEFNRTVTDT